MPTGYTYKVSEQDVSFEEFVWSCARAFGAFIHMRDDNADAEARMPDKSSYHAEELAKSQQELVELHNVSLEAAAALSFSEWETNQKRAREGIEKERLTLNRYNAMLEQVQAWVPPTVNHEGLKNFMIEQLKSSIQFDSGDTYFQEILNIPRPSPEEWLKDRIDSVKRDCKYHAEHLKKDEERYEHNVKWINDLMESVPRP